MSISQAPSFGGRRRDGVVERLREVGRRILPPAGRAWLRQARGLVLNGLTLGRGYTRRLPDGDVVRVSPLTRGLSWNLDEYRAFRAATPPGAIVCDIGANAGAYALLFGQWAGPAGHVFAFEPSATPRRSLERHIALNRLRPVVEIVPAAVGDRCTEAEFLITPPDGMHRLASETSVGGRVRVAVTTLDRFCEERRIQPTVIKIDVEGFELAVLRGARQTLQRVGRGLEVFMEIHPSLWPEIGIDSGAVAAELRTQGLVAASLVAGRDAWSTEGVCLRLRRETGP